MKSKRRLRWIFTLCLAVALVLTACPDMAAPTPSPEEVEAEPTPVAAAEEAVDRTGTWVDEVVAVEEPLADAAITRLGVGDLDVYAFAVSNPEVFQQVQTAADMDYVQSFGSNTELTFNPAGPVFDGTGRLNPFAVPRIREAMNWLIDREYIAQEIYGGLAVPRYLAITSAFPDYARLVDVARELEIRYAYDPERANEVITAEMEALGAELVGGTWQYEGEPVELILLIRTEDERREIGDYLAAQLEDLGFVVRRDYRTAQEAGTIWNQRDPNEGLFHIYTGGWVTTVISRDQAANFNFYFTPRGLPRPLWQEYSPTPEFDEVADRLARRDFRSMEERKELFAQALELAMEDSVRIWLVDRLSFSPFRADVTITGDLAGGINGSWLWPHTLRRVDEVGGTVHIAMPSILPDPWNPIGGSNWVFDQMLIRSTGDLGLLPDPFTGLSWPQRVERAEVFIAEGLPVARTHDWVELTFVPTNEVPEDAWIDWDAAAQRFITVGEKHPEGLTANRKSITYYPADLYDLRWHDGSTLSLGDIVMGMILLFDKAKEESAIFDEAQVPALQTFQEHFRGMRIVQEDPLVVEYYSDLYLLDAEQNVTDWMPYYSYGPGAWHTLGMGIRSEMNNELAFTSDKADNLQVEWMSYIAGPSLEILARHLAEARDEGFIPYEPTLGEYITAQEAQTRWQNLQSWYNEKGHFWVGLGPLFLERAFTIEGTVQLMRHPDYPDPADKWARFEEARIAEVEIDGPGRVTIGAEATFDVLVSFQGEPYTADTVDEVKYLVFDARGELALSGEAEAIQDGLWQIVLSGEQTTQLETGANRLEVAVVPLLVSIPTLDSLQFVTSP